MIDIIKMLSFDDLITIYSKRHAFEPGKIPELGNGVTEWQKDYLFALSEEMQINHKICGTTLTKNSEFYKFMYKAFELSDNAFNLVPLAKSDSSTGFPETETQNNMLFNVSLSEAGVLWKKYHHPEKNLSLYPQFFINGSLNNCIPSHNQNEILDALIALISEPEANIVLPIPDFPSGSTIYGLKSVGEMQSCGKGAIRLRAVCTEEFEEDSFIIAKNLPWGCSSDKAIESIIKGVDKKTIEGLKSIKNVSNDTGMLKINVENGFASQMLINNLYLNSVLESSFMCNLTAFIDNEWEQGGMLTFLKKYIELCLDWYKVEHGELAKEELIKVWASFKNEKLRLSQVEDSKIVNEEDLVPDEPVALILTSAGYIKRTSLDSWRTSKRGAKGVVGMELTSDLNDNTDSVSKVITTTTHQKVAFITNNGKFYLRKALHVPEEARDAKGKHLQQLLELPENEKVVAMTSFRNWENFLLFTTADGKVKRCELNAFSNVKNVGITAIKLDDNDYVIDAEICLETEEIMIISKLGLSIRFPVSEVRAMGRAAGGIAGINIENGDLARDLVILKNENPLLVVGENGIGKKSLLTEFPQQGRGGKGVIAISNAAVCGAMQLGDDEEVLFVCNTGQSVRLPGNEIPEQGRNTEGVKLINISQENDKLVNIAII